jgi:hypothetical protein
VYWSPDAHVLVRPARAFEALAAQPEAPGLWVMVRRPLFLALAFGCLASMVTSGGVTARLALSVPIYWSFLPVTEILALLAVTATRREAVSRSTAVDLYFTGHAAWMLYLLAVGLMLSSAPASMVWQLLTSVVLLGLGLVIAWSAYVDYWFFRTVFAASPRRAIRDTALVRLITWPIVCIVFAIPVSTPWGIVREIGDAIREIF